MAKSAAPRQPVVAADEASPPEQGQEKGSFAAAANNRA